MKKIITSNLAPKAIGPYSQAVLHDSRYTLEFSGALGINPQSGKLENENIATETNRVLDNISALLSEVGWDFSNIVKARIFLLDMKDFATVNQIYASRFIKEPPARVTVAVKGLPLGANVEIECVAAGDKIK